MLTALSWDNLLSVPACCDQLAWLCSRLPACTYLRDFVVEGQLLPFHAFIEGKDKADVVSICLAKAGRKRGSGLIHSSSSQAPPAPTPNLVLEGDTEYQMHTSFPINEASNAVNTSTPT